LHRSQNSVAGYLSDAISAGEKLLLKTPSDVRALSEVARAYRDASALALNGRDRSKAAGLLKKSAEYWRASVKRSPLDVEFAANALQSELDLARTAVVIASR
jgi:hypothetical protein